MKKERFLLVLVLLLAAFLRLWQLGVVPGGVTHDEIGYIYNSYSIAKTGRNVFGEFLPFLTWVSQGGFPFLPVPTYFSIPFFWLFGLSATVGRLPSALLGIFDVLLVYVLVKQLFKKGSLAILSALFLAVSPWHLHFSRSAYDPNFSMFFYLLGIVAFFYEGQRKRFPVISIISFFLAIFSYRGMNVVFVPLIILLLWYGLQVLTISRRQFIAFSAGVGITVAILLFVIVKNGQAYLTAEGSVFANSQKRQEYIDIQIREAQGPLFVRRLFLNKPMVLLNQLRENYVRGYSPEFLFLYTEPNKIFSINSRGRIYFIDIVFIILGIGFLFKLTKRGAFFITMLILIGGLPGMLGGFPYSARNLFLSLLFPILVAGGALFLWENVFLKKIRAVVFIVVLLSYSYAFGSYVFDYYGRFALYGAEPWFKSLKDVSNMIINNKDQYNKIIVGTASFGDFLQYGFYAKVNPSEIQNAWKTREKGAGESYSIGKVTFSVACLENKYGDIPSFETAKPVLYIVHESCAKLATPSGVIRDYPRNTIWKVYTIDDKK